MGTRFQNTVRIQGAMLLVLAASMLIPFIQAVYYQENSSARAFAIVLLVCLSFGLIIRQCCKPSRENMKVRDGFLVVSVSWLLCSVIGALPFWLSGAIPSAADAFFESCSGFTTTGASILTDIEAMPKSLLFWRSFTHWLGGMGIVVFVMALLPVLGISGQIAANAETPGPTKDKLTAHFSDTARNLYLLYLVFTLAEVLLLKLGGMNFFDAFLHSFGTIGTGGFSNYNNSIAHFDSPYIQIVILLFMILAGTNFNLLYLTMTRKRGLAALLRDEENRFYLAIIGVATLLVFAANQVFSHFQNPLRSLLDSAFQIVSIITTTGYMTADYDLWPTFSKMVLLCLFFFGGSSSSTSGGVKCVRVLICLKLIRRSFSLRLHPNRIVPITLNDTELPTEVIIKITNFVLTYIAVIFVGTLLVSVDNLDFISTFSAVATCVGNIGPGFHLLGPTCNFSILSDFSTVVCGFLMLAGRLELITVFALFSRYYWNSNKTK